MTTYATVPTLKLLNIATPHKIERAGLVRIDKLRASTILRLGALLEVGGAELAALIGTTFYSIRYRMRRLDELSSPEVDAVLRIGRILHETIGVFGDIGEAVRWLKTDHPMLGVAPIKLMGSDAGSQAISDELARVQFGDLWRRSRD